MRRAWQDSEPGIGQVHGDTPVSLPPIHPRPWSLSSVIYIILLLGPLLGDPERYMSDSGRIYEPDLLQVQPFFTDRLEQLHSSSEYHGSQVELHLIHKLSLFELIDRVRPA
jgi:hypothetical protein